MPIKELIYERQVEVFGINVRSSGVPPIGLGAAMVKSYSTKQPRITQHKSLACLLQDKMVVFFWSKTGRLASQFSAHSKVDTNPAPKAFATPDSFGAAAAKFEQELFSSGKRPKEFATGQMTDHLPSVRSTKNPFLGMELHCKDLLTESAVPLSPKKFDLS
jgi:hypothetical protein